MNKLATYDDRSLREVLRCRMAKVWNKCPHAIAYGVVDFEVYWRRGRWQVRPYSRDYERADQRLDVPLYSTEIIH